MTQTQRKRLFRLIHEAKLSEDGRRALISSFTHGRSISTKDMTERETDELIKYLMTIVDEENRAEKMRRKIISMAHEMGWEAPLNPPAGGTARKAADMRHINEWCEKYGYMHKKLNDHTYKELPALVNQFQKVYRNFLNNI